MFKKGVNLKYIDASEILAVFVYFIFLNSHGCILTIVGRASRQAGLHFTCGEIGGDCQAPLIWGWGSQPSG